MGRVRLRSDLLKFKDRKMSHFVLLREIDIFLSLNFVNHLARPKAAQLHIFPRTTFYFLQLCKYAPIAATQGTVEIMPTEPAIDLINSMATKSVFISWINETP